MSRRERIAWAALYLFIIVTAFTLAALQLFAPARWA